MDNESSEISVIDKEITKNPEEVVTYGSCFWGSRVDAEKFQSLLSRGIVPEKWIRSADMGYSNASFDSVCLTVIPQDSDAKSRFEAMSGKRGNMNHFVDGLLEKDNQTSDKLLIGIIVDLPEATNNPSVISTRANGFFDSSLYPTQHIDGLDDHQLSKGKRGRGGGFRGEIRLAFNDDKDSQGVSQESWKGIIVQEENYPILVEWGKTAKETLPVFTPEMTYLGTIGGRE